MEAGELLVDPGLGVVAVDEGVGEHPPSIALVDVRAVLGGGGRPAEVPSRHHVGERVVVDRFVILVRSDDPVDVRRAVALDADAGSPVPRRLDEDGGARRPVRTPRRRSSRCSTPPPTRRRRRCAPRVTRCGSARGRPARSRAVGGVTSRPVRADSHGNRAPDAPSARGGVERGGQAPQPVLDHRPRRFGVRRGEEGQHEHVGVPEDVSPVRGPGQTARADGRLGVVADGAHQVEERKAHRRAAAPRRRG